MKDWRGNEILIGSRVVYAFNTSTSVVQAVEGVVMGNPYMEGRQRIPRITVHVSRWTGPREWPWGREQAVKANTLTVLGHDPA